LHLAEVDLIELESSSGLTVKKGDLGRLQDGGRRLTKIMMLESSSGSTWTTETGKFVGCILSVKTKPGPDEEVQNMLGTVKDME
jgi:hypothetical protein